MLRLETVSTSGRTDSTKPLSTSSNLGSTRTGTLDTGVSRRSREAWEASREAIMSEKRLVYTCTFCGKSFRNQFDWTRHETAVHLSHVAWICMATGPVTEDDVCVFCSKPQPDEAHLQRHRVSDCLVNRTLNDRTFTRKDLLLQHVRGMHLGKDVSNSPLYLPESWKVETEPLSIHPLWCGFCVRTLSSTAERMSHVAQHFKDGLDMSTWRPPSTSLVREYEQRRLMSNTMDISDPTPTNIEENHQQVSVPRERRDSITSGSDSDADDLPADRSREMIGVGTQFVERSNQPRRSRITAEARDILTASFEQNPYPDAAQIDQLAHATQLTAKAVRTWMSNTRARSKGDNLTEQEDIRRLASRPFSHQPKPSRSERQEQSDMESAEHEGLG
jgi:hypothetical protein